MATEGPQIPMEILHRVFEVPMIELAVEKSMSTYNRVKDSHQLVHWVLSTAESSLTSATKSAAPIARPIARTFSRPINFVDYTLCLGLDTIEKRVPIIKEKPEQILENAYMLAVTTVQPAVSKISYANEVIKSQAISIKDVSWNRVNQLLSTYYGTAAVNGVDSAAELGEQLLDKYFPTTKEEKIIEPCSAEEDKLLHTLQTVGRLSNKAARRVYSKVIRQLRTLNNSHLKIYINSLVQFLHLTHYINVIDDKVQNLTNNQKAVEPEKKTN